MNWKYVILAFGTLFLAELGDKTQLAVFTMVSEYKDFASIFVGAASALVVTTLLGALAGRWVSDHIPAALLQGVAGLLFLFMGIKSLWGVFPSVVQYFKG